MGQDRWCNNSTRFISKEYVWLQTKELSTNEDYEDIYIKYNNAERHKCSNG